MSPGDLLKNLSLDAWYKVVLYLGGVVFVLSLFVPVQGMSNRPVQAVAGGLCLLGLGVWLDQKTGVFTHLPDVDSDGDVLLLSHQYHYWSPGLGLLPAIGGIAFIVLGILAVIY